MFQAIKTSGLWFRVPVTLQNSYEVQHLNQFINKGKRKKQSIFETIGRIVTVNCEFVLHGEYIADHESQCKLYRIQQMTAERLDSLMNCVGATDYLIDRGWIHLSEGGGFEIGEFDDRSKIEAEKKIKTKRQNW